MKRIAWIPWIVCILLIAYILFVGSSRSSMNIYLDVASLGVSLGLPFLLLLTQYSLKEMANAFRYAGDKAAYDEKEIKKAVVFFETFRNLLIAAGCFGTMVAIVAIFQITRDPEIVGKSMGVGLICLLYSSILIFTVTIPFANALKKKLAASK